MYNLRLLDTIFLLFTMLKVIEKSLEVTLHQRLNTKSCNESSVAIFNFLRSRYRAFLIPSVEIFRMFAISFEERFIFKSAINRSSFEVSCGYFVFTFWLKYLVIKFRASYLDRNKNTFHIKPFKWNLWIFEAVPIPTVNTCSRKEK